MKRLRSNPIFQIVSFVVLLGWAVVLVWKLAIAGYDMATLEGCVETYTQISADYTIAYQHIPPTGDPKVEAGYIVEIERTLERRVGELFCPTSTQDEQAAFVAANQKFTALMNTIAAYGIPQDEQGQALLWVQLEAAGDRAYAAQQAFEAALVEEYKTQHPPAAQAAPAQ